MAHDGRVSSPQPTGRSNRGLRQNVGDMLRSMAVVLVVVGAIMLVTWRPQPDPVRAVPIEPTAAVASAQADFPLVIVDPVHAGTVTSVRWQSTEASDAELVWHVGYVTESGDYLQLSQSLADSENYLAEQTYNAEPLTDDSNLPGAVQKLEGEGWIPWVGGDRRALVRSNDGSTTVVSGTANWAELADAASHLVLP